MPGRGRRPGQGLACPALHSRILALRGEVGRGPRAALRVRVPLRAGRTPRGDRRLPGRIPALRAAGQAVRDGRSERHRRRHDRRRPRAAAGHPPDPGRQPSRATAGLSATRTSPTSKPTSCWPPACRRRWITCSPTPRRAPRQRSATISTTSSVLTGADELDHRPPGSDVRRSLALGDPVGRSARHDRRLTGSRAPGATRAAWIASLDSRLLRVQFALRRPSACGEPTDVAGLHGIVGRPRPPAEPGGLVVGIACSMPARSFITKGPYWATGSPMGRPCSTSTSAPAGPAVTVTGSSGRTTTPVDASTVCSATDIEPSNT